MKHAPEWHAPAWSELQREIPEPVRYRILKAADFRCATCGVEDGRTILRRYTRWPDPTWVEFNGDTAARRAWDAYTLTVRLMLWAPTWPWELGDYRALCMGCVIRADVAAAAPVIAPARRTAQRELFA